MIRGSVLKRTTKKDGKLSIFLGIIVGILLITYGFIYIDKQIKPTVLAIAEIQAQEIASKAINESIHSKITDDISYQDLYFIKTDQEGNITFMQANTIMMNKLAAEVALTVQDTIRSIKTTSIKVPLGNIFGSQLLAQHGPNINISVTPIGSVSVNFFTEFQESGINQTRHKIYLVVKTEVRTIIPFSSSRMMVESTVPIAETIIVGKVPESYINVPPDEFLNVVN